MPSPPLPVVAIDAGCGRRDRGGTDDSTGTSGYVKRERAGTDDTKSSCARSRERVYTATSSAATAVFSSGSSLPYTSMMSGSGALSLRSAMSTGSSDADDLAVRDAEVVLRCGVLPMFLVPQLEQAYQAYRLDVIPGLPSLRLRVLAGILFLGIPIFSETFQDDLGWVHAGVSLVITAWCMLYTLVLGRRGRCAARSYDSIAFFSGLLCLLLSNLTRGCVEKQLELDDLEWQHLAFEFVKVAAVSVSFSGMGLLVQFGGGRTLVVLHVGVALNVAIFLATVHLQEDRSGKVLSFLLVTAETYIMGIVCFLLQLSWERAHRMMFAEMFGEIQHIKLLEDSDRKKQERRTEIELEDDLTRLLGSENISNHLRRSRSRQLMRLATTSDDFRVGDVVKISKETHMKGQLADVLDPNWNGMVKVQMQKDGKQGMVRSFLKKNLVLVHRLKKGEKGTVDEKSRIEGLAAAVLDSDGHGLAKANVQDDQKTEARPKSYLQHDLQASSNEETTQRVEVRFCKYLSANLSVPPPSSDILRNQIMQRPAEERAPNWILADAMMGLEADWGRIQCMSERIFEPDYELREFYEDCMASFPELTLFFLEGIDRASTSGRSGEAEYQRTIGALFAVYWLLRLHLNGRHGFCFGVDENWKSVHLTKDMIAMDSNQSGKVSMHSTSTEQRREYMRLKAGNHVGVATAGSLRSNAVGISIASTVSAQPSLSSDVKQGLIKELASRPWSQLNPDEKRVSFFLNMDWSKFVSLVEDAGCLHDSPERSERVTALLCLTAFHDIMKIEDLQPVVQPGHGPYLGYADGVQIMDHDVALSYLLFYFPNLLPSYAGLLQKQKNAVLFTQGKMQFNHGWFVQAEAPPGAMLKHLRAQIQAGAAASDVSLYFLHWLTDLAGAAATPLSGAEQFVVKFPQAVLASFMWSMPFLEHLIDKSETQVVEMYLRARWKEVVHDKPVPTGWSAAACMRLAVMARDYSVVHAFHDLPQQDQFFLAKELSRTGCAGQHFTTSLHTSSHSTKGPAVMLYYGPALMQRNAAALEDAVHAVRVMCQVFRAARYLWPATEEQVDDTVSIVVAELKTQEIRAVVGRAEENIRSMWILVRHNDREGAVCAKRAADINVLHKSGMKFCVLDFAENLGPEYLTSLNPEGWSSDSDDWDPCVGRDVESL